MKITIEEEMPINPPKRVVLELTEDEALALAAIMGKMNRSNTSLTQVRDSYFQMGPDRKRLAKIDYQTVLTLLGLYYEIPKHLGYK